MEEMIDTSRITVRYSEYACLLFGSRIDKEIVPLEKKKGIFLGNIRSKIIDESNRNTDSAFYRIQEFLKPLRKEGLVHVLGDCPRLNGVGLAYQEIHTRTEACEQIAQAVYKFMPHVDRIKFVYITHGLHEWSDFFERD